MAGKKGSRRRKFPSLNTPDPTFQIKTRIRQIGEEQERINSFTRGHKAKEQELKEKLAELCRPVESSIEKFLLEIFILAKDNRRRLTQGTRKKVLKFIVGIIEWRFTPYKTTIHNPKKVIKWMEENGFGKYIRRVPEVDRQLLVHDRVKIGGRIEGVSINRTEEFAVTPGITKTRVAFPIKRLERLARKTEKKKTSTTSK